MFNFFNNNKNKEENQQQPDWIPVLEETKERLFIFLSKLEERMQELIEAAVPELESLKLEDERGFGTMLNGINGQLNSIRDKARKTYEEKVGDLYSQINYQIDVFHPFHDKLTEFRTKCSDRYNNEFEEKYNKFREQLTQTTYTDYEIIYQQILDEHEQIKDKFKCHQCGDTIPLTKIYFTTSHLTCPSCQTKNTFNPSTLARGLEQVGRGLAEQRTKHLLDKYEREGEYERELYHQAHSLKLKSYNIQDSKEKEQQLKQISDLETLRIETDKNTPQLYQIYQRAMFDEWKKLVPDLAEQTENFYQNLQKRKF